MPRRGAVPSLKRKIEALIFISEVPIALEEIASFLSIDINECKKVTDELINDWEGMSLSIKIEQIGGGYQFRTEESYKDLLTEFINKKPFKLSRAALEVLGIVAKKQPVTKIEIEKIRGVDSTGVTNVLLERGLIQIVGEKEVPGRPYLYTTTNEFLETFSLNDIADLPDIEEFDDYDSIAPKDNES